MINNISIKIGRCNGGWHCRKCYKSYNQQPIDGFVCDGNYMDEIINKERLSEVIHELSPKEIDNQIVMSYIDNPTQYFPEIDIIFNSEKKCHLYEFMYIDWDYKNIIELIENRYGDRVYDYIEQKCSSTTFEASHDSTIDECQSSILSELYTGNDQRDSPMFNFNVSDKGYFS